MATLGNLVSQRKGANSRCVAQCNRIGQRQDGVHFLLGRSFECLFDFVRDCEVQNCNLQCQIRGGCVRRLNLKIESRIRRVSDQGDAFSVKSFTHEGQSRLALQPRHGAMPVTFAPGRSKLETRPVSTGSEPSGKTMGMELDADFAA